MLSALEERKEAEKLSEFGSKIRQACRELQEPKGNVQVTSFRATVQISEIIVTFDPEEVPDATKPSLKVTLERSPDLHQGGRAQSSVAIRALLEKLSETKTIKGVSSDPNLVEEFYFSQPISKTFVDEVINVIGEIHKIATWNWLKAFWLEVKKVAISCPIVGCEEKWEVDKSTSTLNLSEKISGHIKSHGIEKIANQFAWTYARKAKETIEK